MVALATSLSRMTAKQRSDVRLTRVVQHQGSSVWRSLPITTIMEWCANGSLYLRRFHPHLDKQGSDCSGRFRLWAGQVRTLLTEWEDVPGYNIWLPQPGWTRTRVERLPDGGVQLTHYERGLSRARSVVDPDIQACYRADTFRVFAQHVQPFLEFARQGLEGIEAETRC